MNTGSWIKIILAAALPITSVTAGQSAGQTADTVAMLEESLFFDPIPVVASATRLPQTADETPAAVTVIDRRTIEASGAVEVVDLLRLVPGFQVTHTTGNLFTVTSHGTGTPWFSRVQVMVDGHSVYHTAFSGLDWAQLGIALDDIERIEVVRGPNIATWGANAVQGSVNIVTRRPFEQRGAYAEATLGDRGRADLVARWADRIGKMDYRLTYNHRENDGFADQDDGSRLDALSFHGTWNPTASDEVAIYADLSDGTFGDNLGENIFTGDFATTDRDVDTNSQVVRWSRNTGGEDSWYLQLSRDHYRTDEDQRVLVSDLFGIPPAWVYLLFGFPDQTFAYDLFDAESDRYDIEFQRTQSPAEGLRLAWGAGYRHDRLRHFLFDSDDYFSADSLRAFGNLEWHPTDRLVVNLGAFAEDNDTSGSSTLSPRLGVNFAIDDTQTVRAAITRAHKHPSLLEANWNNMLRLDDGTPIYHYTKTNPDLDAERHDEIEIGYLGRWMDDRLSFDARLYHSEVDGAVIYARDDNCAQPLLGTGYCYIVGNYMDYDANGLELELEYHPSARTFARLWYAYADVDGEFPVVLDPYQPYDLAQSAPRHSGGLLLSHQLGMGWQASMTLYHADTTDWNIDGERVDGYTRVDLRLAKRLDFNGVDGRLEFIVQNLGDDYAEFFNANVFDTRALVRLAIQFD